MLSARFAPVAKPALHHESGPSDVAMWRATWRSRAALGAAAGAAAFALPTAYAKPLPSPTGQSPTSQVGGGRKERTESFNRADSFIDWQGAIDTDYVEALRALRSAYKLPLDMMRSLATHFKSEAVAGLAGQPSRRHAHPRPCPHPELTRALQVTSPNTQYSAYPSPPLQRAHAAHLCQQARDRRGARRLLCARPGRHELPRAAPDARGRRQGRAGEEHEVLHPGRRQDRHRRRALRLHRRLGGALHRDRG